MRLDAGPQLFAAGAQSNNKAADPFTQIGSIYFIVMGLKYSSQLSIHVVIWRISPLIYE
jgi:hypothetical protein